MAEDEVRKHAKSALKILGDKKSDWKHKAKDIFLEILIIIFAVTVSIWFHNWSDRMQDHKDEVAFLTGFKKDLQGDIDNIKSSRDFYENALKAMQYFARVGRGDTLNKDSLIKYNELLLSSTTLEPHTSRYEALKSSNKLDIIENTDLLNHMINLNESTLDRIQMLNEQYLGFVNKTLEFTAQNAQLTPAGDIKNIQQILRNSQWRLLMSFRQSSIQQNIIPADDDGIDKCNDLIKEIDKELN